MKRDSSSIRELLDRARSMHQRGLNCAETVLWALSTHWDLGEGTAAVTGLGGGIARSGATCGALTGAIVALGSKVGRDSPEDEDKKQLCYRLGQEIVKAFDREIGSTLCKDIIGFVLAEQGGGQRYAQGGFKDGKCRNAVEAAVRAVVEIVDRLGV